MIAIFSLRLAVGLLACLLILPSAVVNPRFYRTHFLTALGLIVLAALFRPEGASDYLLVGLIATGVICFAGSVIFLLDKAPGSRVAMVAGLVLAVLSLFLVNPSLTWSQIADDSTGAAVLGCAMTAMLMGHSYLIAPTMSLVPLQRLLAMLATSLVLRMALAGFGLWSFTRGSGTLETETMLWLVVRWAVGFLIPLVLCWMAWETTKIRSTQSATGILYVAVVFCFLGEAMSQLLQSKTAYTL